VVIVLHGSLDTPVNIAGHSRFDELAEARNPGFLVVYPEMQTPLGMHWGYTDDISFFEELPKAIAEAGYPVNHDQVFVTGHSAGGTMSLFLQNNMPHLFKGAAAVESGVGNLMLWHNHSFGAATMVVWNHNDPVLAEFGGDGLYQQTLRKLRRHDPAGAEVGPQNVTMISGETPGVMYAERLYWPAVGEVPPLAVMSYRTLEATHAWSNPMNIQGAAFDAAAAIWSFFEEQIVTAPAKGSRGTA
jgi:poly(3-hydroxybutyrate) depolymerase